MEKLQKRIALVCFSNSLGGLELSAIRLAKAMKDRSILTLLIGPPESPLEQRAQEAAIPFFKLAPRWKYGDLSAAMRLAGILKDNRIDLVVLLQSKDIHLAAFASMISRGSKLVFYQQMGSRYNKRDIFHTWIYSKLSLWISLTQSMKNDVLTFTRVAPEKVKVVPIGTDLHQFDPSYYKMSDAREHFGLPQNNKIVGVLGRLDKLKGQHIFLQAVPEVLKKHPDVIFLIAGDETEGQHGYKEYLQNLCNSLKIERFVKYLPFTDDVPRLIAALDVFVLPSFSESYGLVVVEAMAMEKPIIATNSGGMPEIITNGRTGLLIKPQDANAVAQAIHRVLTDAALRSSLAHSARAEALRRYDFDKCMDDLLGSLAIL